MSLPRSDQLLSIQEAASMLHVSIETLRRWDSKGVLMPHRTSGNQRRYTFQQLQQFRSKNLKPQSKDTPVTIQEAAGILGVSIETLRRWDQRGALSPARTPGNQRRYTIGQLEKFKKEGYPKSPTSITNATSTKSEGEQFDSSSNVAIQKLSNTPIVQSKDINYLNISNNTEVDQKESFFSRARANNRRIYAAAVTGFLTLLVFGLLSLLPIGNLPLFESLQTKPAVTGGNLSGEGEKFADVLAGEATDFQLSVNIPAIFTNSVNLKKGLEVSGIATLSGGLVTNNQNGDFGTGIVIASNIPTVILDGITAGTGMTVTNTDPTSPTITNTGVLSLQGSTGALSLSAGSGISISGLTISSTSSSSSSDSFANIAVDGTTAFSAGSATDTLTFTQGSNIAITADTTAKSLTLSLTGTIPIANGGTNTTSIGSAGSIAYSTGSAYAFSAVGTSGQCLSSGGTSTPSWIDCAGANYWQRNLGALSPTNITNDVLVGGSSTSSAKIRLAGLSGGHSFFNTGGNVGIGTTAPGTALQIGDASSNVGITLRGQQTADQSSAILFEDTDNIGNLGFKISYDSDEEKLQLLGETTVFAEFRESINRITFALSGQDTYFGGNVGIGITTPAGKLQVEGSGNQKALVQVSGDGNQDLITASVSGTPKFLVDSTGQALAPHLSAGYGLIANSSIGIGWNRNVGTGTIIDSSRYAFQWTRPTNADYLKLQVFQGNGTEVTDRAIVVSSTGNIGLGITNPDRNLYISASNASLAIHDSNSGGKKYVFTNLNSGDGSMGLYDESGTAFRWLVNTNGNMGIGTTTPSSFKLEIAGNVGPEASGTRDLGSASRVWNNVYANNFIGGTSGIAGHWQRNSNAISPTNITDDVLVGGAATSSALIRLGGTSNAHSFFNTGGNLGIGDTTPSQKLDVAGSVWSSEAFGFSNTSATPAYTGIYAPAAFTLGFVTGASSVENTRIDANGNLSLTTKSLYYGSLGSEDMSLSRVTDSTFRWAPVAFKFQSLSSNTRTDVAIVPTGSNTIANLFIGRTSDQSSDVEAMAFGSDINGVSGTYGIQILQNGSGSLRPFVWYMGSSEMMRLSTAGNLGIGTTDPSSFKLQVAGHIGPNADNTYDLGASPSGRFRSLYLGPSSLHIQCTTGDGCGQGVDWALGIPTSGAAKNSLQIGVNRSGFTSGTPNITLTDGGNVGIGTTTPGTFKLEIAGDLGPDASGTRNFGSATRAWNNIYANNIIAGSTGTQGYWQRNSNALSPANITDDILLGGTATSSALLKLGGTSEATTFFNTGGNVGIGTTSPGAPLDILRTYSSATAGQQFGERLQTTFAIADTSIKQGIQLLTTATHTSGTLNELDGILSLVAGNGNGGTTTNAAGYWARIDAATGATISNARGLYINNGTGVGTITNQFGVYVEDLTKGATSNYAIYTAGTTQSYFGGNVGIGTTTPGVQLEVIASGAVTRGIRSTQYGSDANAANLVLAKARGSLGSASTISAGDVIGNIRFQGYDGSSFVDAARVRAVANQTFAPSAVGTYMIFETTTDNGGTPTERLRINADGNVGIGTSSPGGLFGLDYTGTSGADIFVASKSGTTVFKINNQGNVGIGTTTPGSQLDIKLGGSFNAFRVTDSSNQFRARIDQNYNFFLTNSSGTDLIALRQTADSFINTGNLGIGTTAPGTKFETIGTASVSGNLIVMPVNGLTGNMGIGNTNPTVKLQVDGTGFTQAVFRGAAGASRSEIDIDTVSTGIQSALGFNEAGVGKWQMGNQGSDDSFFLWDNANSANRIFITSSGNVGLQPTSGNVGIGTTAPVGLLNVSASTNQKAMVQITGSGSQDLFTASESGTTRFVIKQGGNVGIGITAPANNFEVGGNSKMFGTLHLGTLGAAQASTLCINGGAGGSVIGSCSSSRVYKHDINPLNAGDYEAILGKIQSTNIFTYHHNTDRPDFLRTGLIGEEIPSELQLPDNQGNLSPDWFSVYGYMWAGIRALADRTSNLQNAVVTPSGDISIFQDPSDPTGMTYGVKNGSQTINKQGIFSDVVSGVLKAGVVYGDKVMVDGRNVMDVINEKFSNVSSSGSGMTATESAQMSVIQSEVKDLKDSSLKAQNDITKLASETAFLKSLAQGSIGAGVLGASTSGSLTQAIADIDVSHDAIIGNDLIVLGRTTLSDVGVTGTLTAGVLSIDGLEGTLNTVGEPLKIQSLAVENVDFMAGKVVIKTNGDISSKGEVTAKKINVDESDEESKAVGQVIIRAGESFADVTTTALTDKSRIFVTPEEPVVVGTKATGAAIFRISLKEAASEDLKVNWWIVN